MKFQKIKKKKTKFREKSDDPKRIRRIGGGRRVGWLSGTECT